MPMPALRALRLCSLLFALLVAGCGIDGSGHVVSEERPFSPFHAVQVHGQAVVRVGHGSGAIAVVTDDNLQRYVTARVERGSLVIEQVDHHGETVSLDPSDGVEVWVTTPDPIDDVAVSGSGAFEWLDPAAMSGAALGLHLTGSGSIRAALVADELHVESFGSGSLHLRGRAAQGAFDLHGSGTAHAFDLQLETAQVSTTGSGDVEVSVRNVLEAEVSGSGSVRYRGSPTVTQSAWGSGSITRAD